LKGGKKPSEKKKKEKIHKIKKCPKCGSSEVSVVLGMEEEMGIGEWECKKCGWKGADISVQEVSEEEFLKYLEEK